MPVTELETAKIKYYIIVLIRFYFNIDLVSANSNADLIKDFDFTSIDLDFLIKQIENEFQIMIDEKEINKIKSMSDIINLIILKKYTDLPV